MREESVMADKKRTFSVLAELFRMLAALLAGLAGGSL